MPVHPSRSGNSGTGVLHRSHLSLERTAKSRGREVAREMRKRIGGGGGLGKVAVTEGVREKSARGKHLLPKLKYAIKSASRRFYCTVFFFFF